MVKKLFIYLIIYLSISLPTLAYEAFDGKYNYTNYEPTNSYSQGISNQDEEVLFIVDFSNSMNGKLGYTPKVYLAIDAIRSILSNSKASIKIGLRVFGITDKPIFERDPNGIYFNNGVSVHKGITFNKENLCSASSLVLPISRYNSENISDRLSSLKPQGATPIGYSLRQAIQNDFSQSAKLKHIILITDGGENCGDDPCLYIKNIMQLRDDIKIDVIGITVGANAYSQLNCIAKAGNGDYYQVDTPEDFKIKFRQAFESRVVMQKKAEPAPIQKPVPIQKPITYDDGIRYKNYVFEFDN